MAWKFKKWRIRWQKKPKKFVKKRRDRETSRKAHVRFRKNKGKMKQALRKTRIKGKIQQKKNKAMGIYKRLKMARKRFKNILKSDVNLDLFLNILSEEVEGEIELSTDDLDGIIAILQSMKDNIEFEDEEEKGEFDEFIDDALIYIEEFEDIDELEQEDEEFLSTILSFIEEYGEELGYIEDDDEDGAE